jgi:hypothetical protein
MATDEARIPTMALKAARMTLAAIPIMLVRTILRDRSFLFVIF